MKLPTIDGAKNLHSVWDSMIYAYTGTPDMPFSNALWHQIGADADNMESSYEFTPSEFQNMNFDQWALESFELAKSAVYPGVTPNVPLTQAYIDANQDLIKRQVVLGGLRLSYVI